MRKRVRNPYHMKREYCPQVFYHADGNVRTLREIEGDVLRLAIVIYRGQITAIARHLGIPRSTLYRKLRQYRIDDLRGWL